MKMGAGSLSTIALLSLGKSITATNTRWPQSPQSETHQRHPYDHYRYLCIGLVVG